MHHPNRLLTEWYRLSATVQSLIFLKMPTSTVMSIAGSPVFFTLVFSSPSAMTLRLTIQAISSGSILRI